MDQILGSIHDIKTALDLKFDEDLKESSEELAELLGDLEYISRKATDHIELVVKKFTEWHSGVRKIRLAYTETQCNYHLSHTQCFQKLTQFTYH